ncbi:hypothetical protein [Brachybacterium sp. AOP3-A1-3]|uniref:hypothetical protein n=1 Tax=Brachybacterium sp. AOP3-A1-3 TaxID=3457699 RepID=UPI004033D36D
MMIDVLLSGFEPFAGAVENESWQAVSQALPVLRESGLRVEALELPVEFGRSGTCSSRPCARIVRPW